MAGERGGAILQGWDSYFTLLGTAAASLIGLLFVVVTLTAGRDRSRARRGQKLYLTPCVLNFAIVLSLSAMTMVPGLGAARAMVLVAVAAIVGLTNAAWACIGIWAMRASGDPPHWTDLWLYGVAPAAIYAALAAACVGFMTHAAWAPRVLAVGLLALLLVSIRNAWDLVTWLATAADRPSNAG